MTGDRFSGPDRPGDFTGNMARKLAREHKEKVERDRLLAQAIEKYHFDSAQLAEQEPIDYTGYFGGYNLPRGKMVFVHDEDTDDDDEL
jgi:hypothetical protein